MAKRKNTKPREQAPRNDREERAEIYRRISVRMYADSRYQALTPVVASGQALWWYLLTGPHTNLIPGLFSAGRAGLAEALGWEQEDFDRCWSEIEDQRLAQAAWKERVVWIPKAIEHNAPASPSVVVSWRGQWPLIRECSLKWEAYRHLRNYLETKKGPSFASAFVHACLAPSESLFPQGASQPASQGASQPASHQEQEAGAVTGAVPGTGSTTRAPTPNGVTVDGVSGLSLVLSAYEKQHQGVVLRGDELHEVQRWIARGVKPERIAEAINVVGEAMRTAPPDSRPRALWPAAMSKVRDTPADIPIVWHSNERRAPEKPAPITRTRPFVPPPLMPEPPKESGS